jgi:hypothetical protein
MSDSFFLKRKGEGAGERRGGGGGGGEERKEGTRGRGGGGGRGMVGIDNGAASYGVEKKRNECGNRTIQRERRISMTIEKSIARKQDRTVELAAYVLATLKQRLHTRIGVDPYRFLIEAN